MAEFKRRTLVLSTGKQVKLFGSSFAIGKTLEIGEGYVIITQCKGLEFQNS